MSGSRCLWHESEGLTILYIFSLALLLPELKPKSFQNPAFTKPEKTAKAELNSKDVPWLQPPLAFIAFVCVKNVVVICSKDSGTPTGYVLNVLVSPCAVALLLSKIFISY